VIDLADAGGMIAVVDEVLWPCRAGSDSRPGIAITEFSGGMGIIA